MTRCVLGLLLVVPFAVCAAPVPPESVAQKAARLEAETVAKLWGKVESPPGPYIVKPDGNRLTMRTLGWPLQFRHRATLPFRIDREVTGDFDVRVTVLHLDPPDNTVRYEGSWCETGAGLHIAGGDHSTSLYRWKAYMHNGQMMDRTMRSSAWLERSLGRQGGAGSSLGNFDANAAVELRLVRKNDELKAYIRVVGSDWQERPVPAGVNLGPAVTVSLFVGHTTSLPCAATFADFTIEKPAKAGWFR
jgi:hypothetical protein